MTQDEFNSLKVGDAHKHVTESLLKVRDQQLATIKGIQESIGKADVAIEKMNRHLAQHRRDNE